MSRVSRNVARNSDWILNKNDDGTYPTPDAQLSVLMDIRDELQLLNRVMQCSNVARGFSALSKIAARDEQAFKRRVEAAARKRVKRGKK